LIELGTGQISGKKSNIDNREEIQYDPSPFSYNKQGGPDIFTCQRENQ
jgi:hypothetical protein